MKQAKRSFLTSVISLLLCISMLLGTTFAWFTDVVTSSDNVIESGNLDAEMYWSNDLLAADSPDWQNADGVPVFTYDKWEPGYTEVKYIKVANAGNLNFKWKLSIEANGSMTNLADVIDVYYVNPVSSQLTSLDGLTSVGKLRNVVDNRTENIGRLTPGATAILAIAFHMDELAGNEYQNKSICDGGFSLKLLATQDVGESDSFGTDYDADAQWPENIVIGNTASADVQTDSNNRLTADATLTSADGKIGAFVPQGTKLVDGANKVILNVANVENSNANITLSENEASLSIDVHINGVAQDNESVMAITVKQLLPTGLNMGNYRFYHVENGNTVEMTLLPDGQTPVHNNYEYDPATGDVVLHLKSFSEIALVAEPAKWEGDIAGAFNSGTGTESDPYIIANADQMAYFSQAVSKDTDGNGCAVAHYKLISDINFAGDDAQKNDNKKLMFYPVGYWNALGTNKQGELYYGYSQAFMGTFDGNGHTISNIYQNTWLMDGDYDAGYWDAAMGIFGYVYGGTVKNLTVDSFSSDGEFTPTGCVAAYACNSTFENIAITNCNPRVYNTGNGGIVGIGGNSSDPDTFKLTFTNITIDNSNKISALWGSWDVACGGLVGMFRGAGHVHMTNCHVGAQIDVNNDVCGNYQYYWYRYSGMMIGTNKNMITDKDGYTVPETSKFHAENCTVHFGDWNDYYYCELVANSLASYTHDHQFSRLTQIQDVSEIQDANGNWKTTGNYILMNGKTPTDTCYHIMKDANGNLYEHKHDVADATNPNVTETVNGETVLKENNQRIYLPFNQLFTGYGWGVKHIPVYNGEDYAFEGITILDRTEANSVEKFEGKVTELENKKEYNLGDIFNFLDKGVELVPGALTVTVTNLDENNPVSATIVYDRNNWANSTITLSGAGTVQITIQDYYFCTPTTINVTVKDREPEVKFDVVMNNGDFLHRVGNSGTVALDKLFKAKDGVTVGTVSVEVEAVGNTVASGTYSNNAIQFNGTGVVKVTITDNDYCTPTELYLEVVDATNVTGLSGTISGNVVLLNDCGLSSLTVSGRNTVYGNGFTATYTGNGQYLNNGLKLGVINVSENGTLDNLRIVASIYPSAFLYYGSSQLGGYVTQDSNPRDVEGTKTRYYYQLSAVAAKDNATISNCYIYGGRNNIFVNTGDVKIKDTVLECGTVANIQIQSNASHTVTLENLTTIQYQVNPTVGDTSKVMLGAGVLVGPETTENPKIVLDGELKQYNWVTADDREAASDEVAKKIIEAALDATAFNHTVNGKTASNLGIIYMSDFGADITNNTGLPYVLNDISLKQGAVSVQGKVYSVQNATSGQIYSDYVNADRTTVNGWYEPQFKYDDDLGGQLKPDEGGDEFLYRDGDTIYVLFPSGDTKEINLATLVNITKYTGQDLGLVITVKDESGNAVTVTEGKVSLSDAGNYTVTYAVTDTLFYDYEGKTVSQSVEYSWDVTISVSLKDTAIPDAYFEFDSTKQKMGYYKPTLGDVKQYLPFLAGLKIYDYNGQTSYLRFDGSADFNKIASITITGYSSNKASVEIILTDGGVINTQFLARANSGGASTYTGKIKTSNNTVYFVNDGGTSNKEATTTAAYWYVDYYKFTGNNGVAIQSAQQTFSSTGSSASTPSGSFSTTINYTVTYDANGGNCVQNIGYATSASAAVTLPTPTRSGYIFAGWHTAASGGTRVGGAGESYTPTSNITLYAQWGKPCTVTYDANGGSCGTVSGTYNGTALKLPNATKDGYTFLGWFNAAEGGTRVGGAGEDYNPSENITLYAQWQLPITVTYEANGGTSETANELYDGDLTLPTPTRTGYTFLGWYTAATGGTRVGGAGDPYTPSANITLYAQWQINSYTITVKTNNATVKVNGTAVSNNGTISIQYGTQVTVEVTYSESNSRSTTIKGKDGTTYTSPFDMPAQEVTINATSSGGGCVTPDTLVTLADGTQKRIDEVTYNDQLLVWDFYNGKYAVAPAAIIFNMGTNYYDVLTLNFNDGTSIGTINGHRFFDKTLNRYVVIDSSNVDSYIGHEFVKLDGEGVEIITLDTYRIANEYTTSYSIMSAYHYNFVVEGVLSDTFHASDAPLFDYFELGENMTFDKDQMQADIEKYGLYTYEDFADYLTYEQFVGFNVQYFKIAVGKGNYTYEGIIDLINTYLGE